MRSFNLINTASLVYGYIRQFCSKEILYLPTALQVLIEKFYPISPPVMLNDCTMHVLDNNGKLFACGLNKYGQLGLGDTRTRRTLTEVKMPFNPEEDAVDQVFKSESSTIIRTNKGNFYACGSDYYGELGLGKKKGQRKSLTLLSKMKMPFDLKEDPVDEVYVIDAAMIIQTKKGYLYACGWNNDGRLGLGKHTEHQGILKKIPFDQVAAQVYMSTNYTIIRTDKGTLYDCGKNNYDELFVSDRHIRWTLTEMKMPFNLQEDPVDQVYMEEYGNAIIQTKKGVLYACGTNDDGELGLGKSTTNQCTLKKILFDQPVAQVYLTYNGMIIRTKEGKLYGCGANAHGQLGLGDMLKRWTLTEMKIPFNPQENPVDQVYVTEHNKTIIQTKKGALYACGRNDGGELGLGKNMPKQQLTLKKIPFAKEVAQVYLVKDCMVVRTKEGKLYDCGWNSHGQLGLGKGKASLTLSEIKIPIASASLTKEIENTNPTDNSVVAAIKTNNSNVQEFLEKNKNKYLTKDNIKKFLAADIFEDSETFSAIRNSIFKNGKNNEGKKSEESIHKIIKKSVLKVSEKVHGGISDNNLLEELLSELPENDNLRPFFKYLKNQLDFGGYFTLLAYIVEEEYDYDSLEEDLIYETKNSFIRSFLMHEGLITKVKEIFQEFRNGNNPGFSLS